MKYEVEITYTEDWIPPRCRKPRPREVTDAITVEIAEATMADLELVGKTVTHVFPTDHTKSMYYIDQPIYRMGSRLYAAAYGEWHPSAVPDHIERNNVVATLEHVENWFVREGKDRWYGARGREGIEHHVTSFAECLLLVDGRVFIESPEPRYEIVTFGLGHNHGGTSYFIAWDYNNNISWERYFNANDFEAMRTALYETASGRGDTEDVERYKEAFDSGNYQRIEVYVPDAFTCCPQAEHGEGDPFINSIEGVVSASGSAAEAGLLAIALTAVETAA